ncbi:hypothetical protein [Actinoplanes sp. TFC3]|uniref:hypothetical protein n=1 Tax=Actinoplanes sp. TFC3 TaxID=1710355 RepID=UPI000A8C0C25|nr:hypothetical protein [Actinoplanes sp. TFC3]
MQHDALTEVLPLVPEPPRRRRRVVGWLLAVVLAGAAVAGGVVLVTRHRAAAKPKPVEAVEVATAKIERRDLSTTKSISGSLGYGAAHPLAGHSEATVTWLPSAGATIKRGKQLFRADDKPVSLFYGSMPLYRTITGENLLGRDVRIVLENLRALGYRTGTQPWVKGQKDGEAVLTKDLIAAIKRWQTNLGRPANGQIAVGDIEVLSGAVRIDAVSVQPGAPANGPLMSVTSTRKVITVDAEPADAATIKMGDRVTVTLPDDGTAKARVTSVSRIVATEEGTSAPKMAVSVIVDDPKKLAELDSADVRVDFPGRSAKDVLAAPIEALVALAEGGYAVQAPSGLVAVQTGMFADGWVEIRGDGLDEGTDLVVSS